MEPIDENESITLDTSYSVKVLSLTEFVKPPATTEITIRALRRAVRMSGTTIAELELLRVAWVWSAPSSILVPVIVKDYTLPQTVA